MCKRKCMSQWYTCILTHEMEWSTSSWNFLHVSIWERSTFKMDQTWPLPIIEKGNIDLKGREEKPLVMFFAFPFLWKCSDLPRVSKELSCLHPVSFSNHIAPRKILSFLQKMCCGCLLPFSERQAGNKHEGESCYIELVMNRQIVCIR